MAAVNLCLSRFDFGRSALQDAAMNMSDISSDQLQRASVIKEQIEKLQRELASILGTAIPKAAAPKQPVMSKAAKAKLSARMKEIWAKRKAGKPMTAVAQKPKARGKMSPAAKARLSAKLKAYWAKRKAENKK